MWTVNGKAPFRMVRLALPYLEKGGHGRIINIASTDGKRYRDTVSVGYAMSKHAVMALTHAAKFAGWEKGVRVTALCPGAVDTDLVAAIPGVTPSANRIAPETVAQTVAFLLRLPNTASVAELVMNTRLRFPVVKYVDGQNPAGSANDPMTDSANLALIGLCLGGAAWRDDNC
jgi:NAD(P)-dependent dehydrogenase (short-subunit alcohol dehydrogenase family)